MTDPEEVNDIVDELPELAAEFEALLDDWLSSLDHAEVGEMATLSPSTERRLADLGYM